MTAFGPFRFDIANLRLYRESAEIRLTPKAAAILEVLTTRPNALVTHDELLDSVWPGVHVQPEVLKVYIAQLRRALRDSANKPRYIETVHRRGYKFLQAPLESRVMPTGSVIDRLVCRRREISSLYAFLHRASEGDRQLVFIGGPVGIGKTALLNKFLRRAERRQGVCVSLGQVVTAQGATEPFSPVLDALAKLFSGDHGQELIAVFRRSAPGWLLQFPSILDTEECLRLRKELASATSQRMIREFTEAVEFFGRDNLVILGIDDIDRADRSTLDLLEYFFSRSGPAKVLAIATCDSDAAPNHVRSLITRLHARQLCGEINLEALTIDCVERFLNWRYPGSNVGAALAGQLHGLTGGLPLFLRSAVHHMEAQGRLLKTENGWIACTESIRLEELVPPTLKELVELQIQRLPLEDQSILEAASIAGWDFPATSVAYALRKPIERIINVCNRFVRQGDWLRSTGFARESDDRIVPRFRFAHELHREVLYGRQSPSERVQRHRCIALALEEAAGERAQISTPELVQHFVASQCCSKSIKYLRTAARNASRRYAGTEAAALLEQALKFAGRLPSNVRTETELETLNQLGAAYFSSGDFASAGLAWHRVLLKAVRHGRTDVAVSALAQLAFPVGWDNPSRLGLVSAALLKQIDKIEDPLTRAEITLRALALSDIAGTSTPNHSMATEALSKIERSEDPVRIASARISNAALRLQHSEYEGVISDLCQSLPVAMDQNSIDVIRAEWWLSWALLHAGQLGRGQSILTAALEHASQNGNRKIEALFTTQIAWLHVESGAYDQARSFCARRHELSSGSDGGVGTTMCLVVEAMAAIGRKDSGAALELVERAFRADAPAAQFWRPIAETIVLQAHMMKGNIADVQQSACRLLKYLPNMTEKTWKAVALSTCAEAAMMTDQYTLAKQYLEAAMKLTSHSDLPLAQWRVEAAAAGILGVESIEDAMKFRTQSTTSRSRLFESLGTNDPLRMFARM
jgi:hypothetical protein